VCEGCNDVHTLVSAITKFPLFMRACARWYAFTRVNCGDERRAELCENRGNGAREFPKVNECNRDLSFINSYGPLAERPP
jgi:hypothetical protein